MTDDQVTPPAFESLDETVSTLLKASDIPEQVRVLLESIQVMIAKSHDYQNPKSSVMQADYYPTGVRTLFEIIWGKTLRIRSLLEAEVDPKNESLEDAFKDISNYCAISVAYLRGRVKGQDPDRDMFNRPRSAG